MARLIITALILTSLIVLANPISEQKFMNKFVFGELTDELDVALNLIRDTHRSLERFSEFAVACNNLIESGNLSLMPSCDSVTQKFNIELGHFYKENQPAIERFIYPYSIPSSSKVSMGYNSSNVTGTGNIEQFNNHRQTIQQNLHVISKITDECRYSLSQYDLDKIRECMSLTNALDGKIKIFNTNTKIEIDRVLPLGGFDSTLSGNTLLETP